MKNISILFFNVISILAVGQNLTTSQITGQLNTITTAVPFLLITPDARAGGLGDAGCASDPDVYSNYWNTSKNVFAKKKNGVSFSLTPWLRALVPDINLLDMSLYKKIGNKNVIGISGKYFSLGDITYTTITGVPVGKFRPYEYECTISYSRLLSTKFSAGVSARKIYSDLTGGNIGIAGTNYSPGKSFSGDLSCYWKDTIMLRKTISEFAWGVNISNVGKKIKYSNDTTSGDFLPANLRIGVSYKYHIDDDNSIELICDANKLLVPTPPIYAMDSLGYPLYDQNGQPIISSGKNPDRTVGNALYSSFSDAPGGPGEELREIMIASGIEYTYKNRIALRAGYFYEHATKGGRKYLTLGIGGRYKGAELDVAYLLPTKQRHPLQNTMRFTLSWEFDRFCKKKS